MNAIKTLLNEHEQLAIVKGLTTYHYNHGNKEQLEYKDYLDLIDSIDNDILDLENAIVTLIKGDKTNEQSN